MSLKMEKKAQHFVRLLAKKLVENEHAKKDPIPEAQENAELKKGFRRALDNLPKTPLKTELQKNAATYFRKLEVLARNSSNVKTSNGKESPRPKEGKPKSEARKTKDGKKKRGKSEDVTNTPLSQKSSEKIMLESAETQAVLMRSSGELLMNGEKDDSVDMETHLKMETKAEPRRGEGLAFNVYATDSTSEMMDALVKLPAKKKMRLAPHAYNSLCQGKSFSDFLQTLHHDGKDEPAMDNLTLLKQEILTGFGSSDVSFLTRCEANCLSGIITVADEALDVKDMARMKEVKEFILSFLLWVKTQHEALSPDQDKHSHPLSNFEDLAAAMLSIYVDLSIILSRQSDDKGVSAGKNALSKILLFVGHTPMHQLNLLLQVTSPTTEDCQFMVPIYKHMLSKVPTEMTNELLIKYLYAVRFSREVLKIQEKELLDDIVSVALTAEPSEEFLQWMFSTAPSIYRSLPEPVKNRQVPVVEHLIKQVTREYMDTLLDIASDVENESQSLSYETSQESKEEPVGALFFTDTERDEDLARQVDSDAESVDVLHSHLDTLLGDIDKESSSDGDSDGSEEDVRNTRAGLSQRNPSHRSSESKDEDSDLEIIDMDTSAGLDPRLSETLSLEEQRYNSMTAAKDKKAPPSRSSRKVPRRDSGSSQNSPARNAEGKSSGVEGDSDVVLVEAELQVDSDKESFTTAKDNLDTTKESINVEVDEEITFRWKGSRSGGDNNEDQMEEEGEEDADEEDLEDVERDGDDEDSCDEASCDEADGGNEEDETLELEQPSKEMSTELSIPSPKKSQEGIKDIAKKQEQSPDEARRSMHLRSMDAGTSGQGQQSSLLSFFSPVKHLSERQGKDLKKPAVDKVDLEEVEVIPDSCDSGQDEKSSKDVRVTPERRMKSLKALEGDRINSEKTLPDKAVSQSAKGKRLRSPVRERKSRSDQKVKRGKKPISSSSEGEVDPALFLSPVVLLDKVDAIQSMMNPSVIEDAVWEGIRRIRAECVTSPSDLKAQPTTRSSASKLSMSKRKALTITGGVKSKTVASDTPKQLFKRAGEASTPADKATGSSAKKQGVSPLSPSKVKRLAAFGDTYRLLAGISPENQTDSGSEPASQSKTPPKRAKLRPKDLGEVFAADMLSQKRSGKKQVMDIQPMSESSQGSIESGQGSNTPSRRSLAKKPQTPLTQRKRMLVKSASPQEKSASPQQKSASPQQKSALPQQKSASPQQKSASPQEKSASKLQKTKKTESRSDLAGATKGALKRRASLPASKTAKTPTKVSRKSVGSKK
ncbi:uncharacterized protein [Asterias amurensis]|uniref:uncharacterized protein isoform X2 n=1 Tax=Asterias amurensis TaxID=7602 RepID=UPI003AB6892F